MGPRCIVDRVPRARRLSRVPAGGDVAACRDARLRERRKDALLVSRSLGSSRASVGVVLKRREQLRSDLRRGDL